MKKLDIEGLNNDAPVEGNKNEQEESITFSSKLVDYLSLQVKNFKKDNKDTLTTNQLKKVYCHAAREGKTSGIKDINLYALARIHMFLRLKLGDKMTTKSDSSSTIKATKLEIEDTRKSIKLSSFIDISESWTPSEDDLKKAKKEMDENDLKYEYDSIGDLYLEYEPIEQKWD